MIRRIFMMIIPIMLVFYLIVIALVMVPCWFILKKAGFSPWLSLLCIVPSLGTLVLLYVLALPSGRWCRCRKWPGSLPFRRPPPPPLPPQVVRPHAPGRRGAMR